MGGTEMSNYYLAWWNLENLFDEQDAMQLGRRSAKVQRVIQKEISGWTPELRDTKINQLATVVAAMNDGAGPDLLGICEVENRFVVDRLVDSVKGKLATPRNYAVIHADTEDQRGIDVAFIYDADKFDVAKDAVFFHTVMKRLATRDIVQATFTTKTDSPQSFLVFGNHWPSRSAGQLESEAYRQTAGETLAYFHQRSLELLGADEPAIAMGDFNDEPFDRALVENALSTREREKVARAREVPRFWNLMWREAGVPEGTFYFDDEPNVLDQFLVNRAFAASGSRMHVDPGTVHIVHPSGSTEHGGSVRPRPFGGMGKQVDKDGYSDHFPIAMTVELAG